MTAFTRHHYPVLVALAAITGQTPDDVAEAFDAHASIEPVFLNADPDDVAALVARIKTRLGLAPAVDSNVAAEYRAALDDFLVDGAADVTRGELATWDTLLRHTPEHVRTLDRDPVVLPILPAHQTAMWHTLLDLEDLGQPWVLVGGQMTMLHCLENGVTQTRPTNDGDIVVGVWTRRDAFRQTTAFLRDQGFTEERTDEYGYRFIRGEKPRVTMIDVLLPEGVHDQQKVPRSTSGRVGLAVPGANQALTRAERVPITVPGASRTDPARTGLVRRPTLLGSMVAKAHAYVVDSRDKQRHADDLVTLAAISVKRARVVLQDARPGDRRPVRRFLRDKTPQHRYFRTATDPHEVHAFLTRLADPT